MPARPDEPIRFYFDYISSNAYLAWLVLPALAARYERRLEVIPVVFAKLLEAHGTLGPAEDPAKSSWMWKNNLRKSALLWAPLVAPAFHPINPLLSLRASSLPLAAAEQAALVGALFTAVWAESRHVSEPEVVSAVASAVGLDGARLVTAAQAPETKARLRIRTEQAVGQGIFGVPAMAVGDELFWGYDDLPYLEHLLAGTDPLAGRPLPERVAPPRPSAVRRQFRQTGTPGPRS
jgi:2-hydroxychromene-2-carboxylate isomerase